MCSVCILLQCIPKQNELLCKYSHTPLIFNLLNKSNINIIKKLASIIFWDALQVLIKHILTVDRKPKASSNPSLKIEGSKMLLLFRLEIKSEHRFCLYQTSRPCLYTHVIIEIRKRNTDYQNNHIKSEHTRTRRVHDGSNPCLHVIHIRKRELSLFTGKGAVESLSNRKHQSSINWVVLTLRR